MVLSLLRHCLRLLLLLLLLLRVRGRGGASAAGQGADQTWKMRIEIVLSRSLFRVGETMSYGSRLSWLTDILYTHVDTSIWQRRRQNTKKNSLDPSLLCLNKRCCMQCGVRKNRRRPQT